MSEINLAQSTAMMKKAIAALAPTLTPETEKLKESEDMYCTLHPVNAVLLALSDLRHYCPAARTEITPMFFLHCF